MSSVINKTTNQYLTSVHTPDYPESEWVINPDLSGVVGIPNKYWKVSSGGVVEMSTEEKAIVDAKATQAHVEQVIRSAILFGSQLITTFAAENVLLGVTQAGMTGVVRERMLYVIGALQTGSLYEAITKAKTLPPESKDSVFITDTRILIFVNKIETYLNIPLSTSL